MENYVPCRKEGETQQEYRLRQKTHKLAVKMWKMGRVLWEGKTYIKAKHGGLVSGK